MSLKNYTEGSNHELCLEYFREHTKIVGVAESSSDATGYFRLQPESSTSCSRNGDRWQQRLTILTQRRMRRESDRQKDFETVEGSPDQKLNHKYSTSDPSAEDVKQLIMQKRSNRLTKPFRPE
jgi:cell fate regulator YaaT (PSP1 superfamily)